MAVCEEAEQKGDDKLGRVVWGSKDVVVGNGQKLEDTSNVKQWPLTGGKGWFTESVNCE